MSKIYANFVASAKRYPKQIFLVEPAATHFERINYAETLEKVDALAGRLQSLRLNPGSRIAILSPSRIDWVIAFLAANAVGCIAVPLDPQLSEPEWINCLAHAEPSVLIAASQFETSYEKLQQASPLFQLGLYFDSVDAVLPEWQSFNAWSKPLKETANTLGAVDQGPDVAMIVYTSGTSGKPLAVQVTEEALLINGECLIQFVNAKPGKERVFSIAPFHHILGMNALIPVILYAGNLTVFPTIEREILMRTLQELKPTFVIAIPLFYERIAAAIRDKLMAEAPKVVTDHLMKYVNSDRTDAPALHFWRRWLFRQVHQGFGGRVRAMACGGAPLDAAVNRFFHYLGLPLYEGYGMTETTGMFITNRPGLNRIGTLGQVFAPRTEVRLDAENDEGVGEICLKGPLLMKGYYRNPEADRRAFDETGWFHTGDLARMDETGCLSYVGRKKDMIVTSNGKNIYPEELEEHFSKLAMVQELCVFGLPISPGSTREKIHLHIVPDEQAVREKGGEELCRQIKAQVAELSESLAAYKRPTSVAFSYEAMPKTTSLKIKKYQVREQMIRELQLLPSTTEQERYGSVRLTEVEARIIAEIKKLLPPGVDVAPESHLTLDLGLESLTLMALWTKLETMMNITIAAEEVGQWRRVQDVFDYLHDQKLTTKGSSNDANRLSSISTTQ